MTPALTRPSLVVVVLVHGGDGVGLEVQLLQHLLPLAQLPLLVLCIGAWVGGLRAPM